MKTFAIGDRVVVKINDMETWSKDVGEALDGMLGIVEEVKPNYFVPCVGYGIGTPQPGYLVRFDKPAKISGVTVTGLWFHFGEEDIDHRVDE